MGVDAASGGGQALGAVVVGQQERRHILVFYHWVCSALYLKYNSTTSLVNGESKAKICCSAQTSIN